MGSTAYGRSIWLERSLSFVRYGTSRSGNANDDRFLLSLYFSAAHCGFGHVGEEASVRQNWKPEKHYAWTELEQMLSISRIILYLDGKK